MTVQERTEDDSRSLTKFGRYALLEKIGSGGMAEIFRAKTFGAAGFEKEYAIKLITPSLVDDNEFVDMFISEAKIVVNLYHANIVQVFDLGEIDGQYYIAMEYVHGKDLLDLLARCADLNIKLPLDLVLFITMEMLKGLNFAHEAKDPFGEDLNIIHRDISPANILVSYTGNVKVGDFGVAKAAIERSISDDDTLKGKVGYMSPEQVTGQELDARSDIFSAGIVFAEALGMTRLFTGDSDLDVMLQVRDADIGDNLERMQPIPSGLEEILERALAKHPERRYQTAENFYQALVDFSFQHDIKVKDNDLSDLMGLVFEEEIEREKSRRRRDPHSPSPGAAGQPGEGPTPEGSDGSSESMVEGRTPPPESQTPAAEPPSGADQPDQQPRTPEADKTGEPGRASQVSTAEVIDDPAGASPDGEAGEDSARPSLDARTELREATFHFRGGDGAIEGPLELDELVSLLRRRAPDPADRVSVDGSPWRPPNAILNEVTRRSPSGSDEASPEEADTAPPPGARGGPDRPPDEQPPKREQAASRPEESEPGVDDDLEAAVRAMEEMNASIASDDADDVGFDPEHEDEEVGTGEPTRSSKDETIETREFDMGSVDELRDQYLSYEGELDDTPFPRLLARLHLGEATGRLHVERHSVEKSLFLEEGDPIMVDSNKDSELLGSFLLSRDEITRDELDQALARLHEWGGRLGDALVAIGAVQAHEVYELLSEQMEEKILDIFEWPAGYYGFYEGQKPDVKGYTLGIEPLDMVVEGCRQRVPLAVIEEYYAERSDTRFYCDEDPPVDVEDLGLQTDERHVLDRIEGVTTPSEMLDRAASAGLDEETGYRALYLFEQLGVLAVKRDSANGLGDLG